MSICPHGKSCSDIDSSACYLCPSFKANAQLKEMTDIKIQKLAGLSRFSESYNARRVTTYPPHCTPTILECSWRRMTWRAAANWPGIVDFGPVYAFPFFVTSNDAASIISLEP